MKVFLALITILVLGTACQKNEGKGGTSTIKGKVHVINQNKDGEFINEYPGADEDVFLTYGSESNGFNEKVATSYDGSFQFTYLRPGNYTLFAYSKCDSCAAGKEAIKLEVVINDKKEIVNIDQIVIYE